MSCNPFNPHFSFIWGDNRPNIVVSDSPATKYIGANLQGKQFSLFRVDGYIIPSHAAIKCDYLLIRCPDSHCFFIELKGSDLVHASNQIIETIKELRHKLSNHVLNARIVLTRTPVPAMRHANLIRLEQMVKATGGDFKRGNVQLRETH